MPTISFRCQSKGLRILPISGPHIFVSKLGNMGNMGDYDILTTVFRDSVSWWWLCSTTCSWLTSSGCSSKDCIYMQSLFGHFRLMTFAFATTLHSVGVSGFICSNVLPVFCFFFGFYYSSFLRVARLYSLVIRSAQQYGIVSFSVLIYAHKFFGPDQQMPTPHTPLASG